MPLLWKEQPLRELIRLAWPIAISTLSYSVMTVVDTILDRSRGPRRARGGRPSRRAHVPAALLFDRPHEGAKVLVSQAIGARRSDRARGYHGRCGRLVALAVGLVTIVLGQFLATVVGRLTASEAAGIAAS